MNRCMTCGTIDGCDSNCVTCGAVIPLCGCPDCTYCSQFFFEEDTYEEYLLNGVTPGGME